MPFINSLQPTANATSQGSKKHSLISCWLSPKHSNGPLTETPNDTPWDLSQKAESDPEATCPEVTPSPQVSLPSHCCLDLRHRWSPVFSASLHSNSILPGAHIQNPGVTPDLTVSPAGSTFKIRCSPDASITTGPLGSPGPAQNMPKPAYFSPRH